MSFLDKYMTGKEVPITMVLHTYGETHKIPTTGKEYQAGFGSLMLRLIELAELRKKKSGWWYTFFNGRFGTLEIDYEIKEICEALDQAQVGWARYR
jgi:hypothetical protein